MEFGAMTMMHDVIEVEKKVLDVAWRMSHDNENRRATTEMGLESYWADDGWSPGAKLGQRKRLSSWHLAKVLLRRVAT